MSLSQLGRVIRWGALPKTRADTVYSNNNMTVQLKGRSNGAVYAIGGAAQSEGKSSGKWYWEVTVNAQSSGQPIIGVVSQSMYSIPLTTMDGVLGGNNFYGTQVTYAAGSGNGRRTGGNSSTDGTTTGGITTAAGNIIGVCLDCDNNTLKFYKNGSYVSTADIGIGNLAKPIYPAQGCNLSSSNITVTINLGYSAFAYAIPSGYKRYEGDYNEFDVNSITNLTTNSATIGSHLNQYSSLTSTIYLYWSTTPGVDLTDSRYQVTGTQIQNLNPFSYTMTGLTAGQTYYVRFIAIESNGTVYSDYEDSFTINGVTLSNCVVDQITRTSFRGTSSITNTGGGNITEYGFVYSDFNAMPTTANSKKIVTGTFQDVISNLTMDRTYYVRSYATNDLGLTGYSSNVVTFQTLANTAPTNSLSVDRTHSHNDNIVLSGNLYDANSDSIQYQIYFDGAIHYPNPNNSNEWTLLQASPYIEHIFTPSDMPQFRSYNITVKYKDEYGLSGIDYTTTVYRDNITPTNDLYLSSYSMTTEEIYILGHIYDSDMDTIRYKVVANEGTQFERILQDWTDYFNTTYNMNFIVDVPDLVFGDNYVKVYYEDSLGSGGYWQNSTPIVRSNSLPQANFTPDRFNTFNRNITITGSITDPDMDSVAYRVILNGNTNQPVYNWSDFHTTPWNGISFVVDYTLLSVGVNTITIELKDINDNPPSVIGSNTVNIQVIKKKYASTYIDSTTNHPKDTNLIIDLNRTAYININTIDKTLGYIKDVVLSFTSINGDNSVGTITIKPITNYWDAETVAIGNLPIVDSTKAKTYEFTNNSGTININITELVHIIYDNYPNYGISIESNNLTINMDILNIEEIISYVSTQLLLPQYIYGNRALIQWKELILQNKSSYVSTILQRSAQSNFSVITEVFNTIDFTVTDHLDNTLQELHTYYYRIKSQINQTTIVYTDIISFSTPDVGYRYKLNSDGITYTLELTEGLSFDDPTVDYDFYTTPDKIHIRPLNLGSVIGGRVSNGFAFEVINSYQSLDYAIKLKAFSDLGFAESRGTYGLLLDGPTNDGNDDDHRTAIDISDNPSFENLTYPLEFNLAHGQKKIAYVRMHPTIYASIGDGIFQIVVTGDPII